MSYGSWRVGMKVVCIVPNCTGQRPDDPVFNEVYTVSAIFPCPDNGEILINLVELPSPETDRFFAGWRARGFRPVRKTDISIFTAMLHSTKNEVQA